MDIYFYIEKKLSSRGTKLRRSLTRDIEDIEVEIGNTYWISGLMYMRIRDTRLKFLLKRATRNDLTIRWIFIVRGAPLIWYYIVQLRHLAFERNCLICRQVN